MEKQPDQKKIGTIAERGRLIEKGPLFFLSCLVMSMFAILSTPELRGTETADPSPPELDRYLALPDGSFQWKVVEKNEKPNENTILVEMVSQTWHGIPWKHYLLLALPNKMVYSDHAVLYIGGKRVGRKPGDGDYFLARSLAETSAMPVGMLFQVPNQPLLGDYVEDALIGETLLKALETDDMTWPLLFPMAKSALRGMDAIQQALKQEKQLEIGSFIVTGASKRGWTTWLTAASKDTRVKAIAPIVIDTLNMLKQMEYQVETWGEHSPSIHDYTSRNLVRKDSSNATDREIRVMGLIDPYSYRHRYTMPKILVHGTNDPYWTVDAVRHYWDDLPGVKYILTLPNAGHGLDGQHVKAVQTLAVFARHAVEGAPWPKMEWTLTRQGPDHLISVQSDLPGNRVKLWTARSDSKDFRQAKWSSRSVESGLAEPVRVPQPESGHIAFYLELNATQYGLPFSVTTQVWRF